MTSILFKALHISVIFVLIYLWNRFIIKKMINLLIGFHKRFNESNINKEPIRFLVTNEDKIFKILSSFFWLGGLMIIIGVLYSPD